MVTAFYGLFQHNLDKDDLVQTFNGTDESLSYTDTLSEFSLASLGPELRDLVKQAHIETTDQHGKLFLGLSKRLRRGAWEFFARHPRNYLYSRAALLTLVALYLPDPYTEPLWETTLFNCKELVTSTLIPVLCSWPRSEAWAQHLISETTVCILAFNLALLGFPLGRVPWDCLVKDLPHSDAEEFIEMQEVLSLTLHDNKSSSMITQRLENRKPHDSPLYESLFWVTIARIRWTSIPELQEYCNARHPWGSINAESPNSEVEEIAYALICPDSIKVDRVSSYLSFSVLGALGASLSQYSHLKASVDLLELSLKTYEKTYVNLSIIYGILLAELLKNYIKLGRSEEARTMGYEYLKRPHTRSKRRPAQSDRVYVMISTSDACIALKDYGQARELLSDVLSRSDLDAYAEICSALRLNKVWRRTNGEARVPAFAENLSRVLWLTWKESTPVKEEYLTELQATAYHTKQAQEPLSPSLLATINSSLQLFQPDDGVFHESLTTLRHLVQVDHRPDAAAHEASDLPFRPLILDDRSLNTIDTQILAPSDNRSHARSNSPSPSVVNTRSTSNSPDPSSAKRDRITRQLSERSDSSVNWRERNLLSLGT
jgi:hypothetical protein